jgi:hypothetical protein
MLCFDISAQTADVVIQDAMRKDRLKCGVRQIWWWSGDKPPVLEITKG